MSTIIKPKRATQEEIAASTKVLSKDEILLAIPNEGDHSGKLKLYRGDGITPANELPVGIDGELGDDLKISAFEESTAEENQELEAGASLSRLFGNIKRKFTQVQNETSNKVSSNGDISNTVIDSVDTITADFPEPTAGESTKTYLGKVKKFIADFNSFKNGIITLGRLANNADTTVEGFALDARMGKTLGDRVAQLNSDLGEVNSNLGRWIRDGTVISWPTTMSGYTWTHSDIVFFNPDDNADNRIYFKRGGVWYPLITSTDFETVRVRVTTIANEAVAVSDAPKANNYIPVIVGHTNNNFCQETVFFDVDKWYIYSTVAQVTAVEFRKYLL